MDSRAPIQFLQFWKISGKGINMTGAKEQINIKVNKRSLEKKAQQNADSSTTNCASSSSSSSQGGTLKFSTEITEGAQISLGKRSKSGAVKNAGANDSQVLVKRKKTSKSSNP